MLGFPRVMHDHFKKQNKTWPYSILHMKTLHYIQEHSDVTMHSIAELFSITPPSATSLVGGLVKTGYLSRSVDSKDRRIVHLSLTAKGKKILAEGLGRMALHMKELIMKLNAAEQQQLIKILQKLQRTFTE